jgi:aminoglycoside phosphotransferase (APT) family kinase protein
MDEDIVRALQDYYDQNSALLPDKGDVKITNAISLNVGWESVIYSFDLFTGTQRDRQVKKLILRIYPGDDAHHKSIREYTGMQQLHAVGYPVPAVYIVERGKSPSSKPFIIMEHIEGEIMWPILDRSTQEEAATLLTLFCELFVQLHALDWRDFTFRGDQLTINNLYHYVDQFLHWLQDMSDLFPILKTFIPVIEWLEVRRDTVPCARPAPVHWDYHPGNVIVQPDGGLKVIDWTQIQVSDPRFDLGWTLLLAGAYSGNEIRRLILEEYQRLCGTEIDNLAFFEVANAVKRLGSVMISISEGADKIGMRPDAIATMRRDFPAVRWVYNLMVERTGIRLPEVEQFLET